MLAKFPEIEFSKASTALKIPTNDQIPIPIITMVSMVLSSWVLIESKAISIFSLNNPSMNGNN